MPAWTVTSCFQLDPVSLHSCLNSTSSCNEQIKLDGENHFDNLRHVVQLTRAAQANNKAWRIRKSSKQNLEREKLLERITFLAGQPIPMTKWLSYVVACKSPLCFAQWSIGQGYQYGSLLLTTLVPDYVRDQQLVIEAILQQTGPAMCWRRAPMEVSSHVHKDAPRHLTVSIGSQTVWAWRVRCEPVDGSFQKRWLRGCICKAGIGWSHLISMLNLAMMQLPIPAATSYLFQIHIWWFALYATKLRCKARVWSESLRTPGVCRLSKFQSQSQSFRPWPASLF